MICLRLFLAFLYIGLFTIGGGYASLPIIEEQIVRAHGWLNASEFTDLITISQITPGPIAINAAPLWARRWPASPALWPPPSALWCPPSPW